MYALDSPGIFLHKLIFLFRVLEIDSLSTWTGLTWLEKVV